MAAPLEMGVIVFNKRGDTAVYTVRETYFRQAIFNFKCQVFNRFFYLLLVTKVKKKKKCEKIHQKPLKMYNIYLL